MRRHFGILLLVLSIPGHTRDQCESPTVFAERFFRSDYTSYMDGAALDSLTPEFRAILDRELQCLKKKSLCNLDYVPWTGAQNGEIGKPVRFVLESRITTESPQIRQLWR